MKLLILVRHGDYEKTAGNPISDYGCEQITGLSERLAHIVNRRSVRLMTSTTLRAEQSADIIGETLKVTPEPLELWWSEGCHPEDLEAALTLVTSLEGTVDVLVVVTHYEYIRKFPRYLGQSKWSKEWGRREINTGTAWIIDYHSQTLTHLNWR